MVRELTMRMTIETALFMCEETMKKLLLSAAAFCGLTFSVVAPSQAACSCASHYGIGDGYHGRTTASGEIFNAYGLSAAHRYLPFGTRLRVSRGNRSVIVRINDRGPFVGGRDLDLSYGFSQLASPDYGHIDVCYSVI